jgi:hypothetical protein
MKMKEIFNNFAIQLAERFSKEIYTTEDSIRYTFFNSLITIGNYQHHEIILEYPHKKIPNASIDSYILPTKIRTGKVFEFKYTRRLPGGKNLPRPENAGSLINDLFRLKLFTSKNADRYFIYVTDDEMANYLNTPKNKLDDFFNLQKGSVLNINKKYLRNHCDSLVRKIKNNNCTCKISMIISKELPYNNFLRIYQIK